MTYQAKEVTRMAFFQTHLPHSAEDPFCSGEQHAPGQPASQ